MGIRLITNGAKLSLNGLDKIDLQAVAVTYLTNNKQRDDVAEMKLENGEWEERRTCR